MLPLWSPPVACARCAPAKQPWDKLSPRWWSIAAGGERSTTVTSCSEKAPKRPGERSEILAQHGGPAITSAIDSHPSGYAPNSAVPGQDTSVAARPKSSCNDNSVKIPEHSTSNCSQAAGRVPRASGSKADAEMPGSSQRQQAGTGLDGAGRMPARPPVDGHPLGHCTAEFWQMIRALVRHCRRSPSSARWSERSRQRAFSLQHQPIWSASGGPRPKSGSRD